MWDYIKVLLRIPSTKYMFNQKSVFNYIIPATCCWYLTHIHTWWIPGWRKVFPLLVYRQPGKCVPKCQYNFKTEHQHPSGNLRESCKSQVYFHFLRQLQPNTRNHLSLSIQMCSWTTKSTSPPPAWGDTLVIPSWLLMMIHCSHFWLCFLIFLFLC